MSEQTPSASRIASIRQRLLDRARARGEDFQFVLDRYAVERLLYRLSISPHRDQFLLKGAMLFALWFDQPHRPTRDADFLGVGPAEPERLAGILRELCAIACDDGLTMDVDSIDVAAIREQAEYDGLRVVLRASLGSARCHVQWDVGFGDAVTPRPWMPTTQCCWTTCRRRGCEPTRGKPYSPRSSKPSPDWASPTAG